VCCACRGLKWVGVVATFVPRGVWVAERRRAGDRVEGEQDVPDMLRKAEAAGFGSGLLEGAETRSCVHCVFCMCSGQGI